MVELVKLLICMYQHFLDTNCCFAEEKKPASLPSIKQCLEYEFRKEVEKRCERCKPSTSRSKQVGKDPSKQIDMGGTADETTLLSKLPPVLTIHVMRFMRTGHVEFEENIDLQEYLESRYQVLNSNN